MCPLKTSESPDRYELLLWSNIYICVHVQHINTREYRYIPLNEHLEICGNKQFNIFPFYKLLSGSNCSNTRKRKPYYPFFETQLGKLNCVLIMNNVYYLLCCTKLSSAKYIYDVFTDITFQRSSLMTSSYSYFISIK